MRIGERMLPEFDHEMVNTRKTLERVPEEKFAWKPHEKSTTMGRLATHIAELPGFATRAIETESFDLAPPGAPPRQLRTAASRQELLEIFDRNASAARTAMAAVEDEHLLKPWSLLAGGNVIFTMPRVAVLRTIMMNHIIHHRAQLGVYLRLNDVPVPAIYGPSADER